MIAAEADRRKRVFRPPDSWTWQALSNGQWQGAAPVNEGETQAGTRDIC